MGPTPTTILRMPGELVVIGRVVACHGRQVVMPVGGVLQPLGRRRSRPSEPGISRARLLRRCHPENRKPRYAGHFLMRLRPTYTVWGRHGSCSCASQTSSGSSASTRNRPSVGGSSNSPNQTATSPPTTTGRPPVSTTTTWCPSVCPGAGSRRSPGSSSTSPSCSTYVAPSKSTHSRIV